MVDSLVEIADISREYLSTRGAQWEARLEHRVEQSISKKSCDMLYTSLAMMSEYYGHKAFSRLTSFSCSEINWGNYLLSFELLRLAYSCWPRCSSAMTHVQVSHIVSLWMWARVVERVDAAKVAEKALPTNLSKYDAMLKVGSFSAVKDIILSDSSESLHNNFFTESVDFGSGAVEKLLSRHVEISYKINRKVPVYNTAATIVPLDLFRIKQLFINLELGLLDEFLGCVKGNSKYIDDSRIQCWDVELASLV